MNGETQHQQIPATSIQISSNIWPLVANNIPFVVSNRNTVLGSASAVGTQNKTKATTVNNRWNEGTRGADEDYENRRDAGGGRVLGL